MYLLTIKRFPRSPSCIKKSDKEERGRDEMGWEEEKREMRGEVEQRKGRADEPRCKYLKTVMH